ncbi:phage tail tip fiber protein [Paracoccus sp. 22332]|uniref:phage tail tip fiber protein n=1 Tax=Paracoccus sp. 22332 TaxID=3453913 RepID=UPI003F85D47C
MIEICSAVDGATAAWITDLSARRRQAFDHQAAADIADLKFAMSDPGGAIAGIRETILANWNSLDSRVKSQASAISDRYTKTQTDAAISSGIQQFDATLTSRFGAKANASTVTALANRVTATESGLDAQSDAITQTKARTDRASASGLIRMTSSAGTGSGSTRIALIAEATATGASQQAALYLETNTSGQNAAYVVADRFAVLASRTVGAARTVPFIVTGGRAYMDGAEIADLTVGRLQLGPYSASVFPFSMAAGEIASNGGESVLASLTLTKGRSDPMPLFFRATMYSTQSATVRCILRLYRNSTLIETRRIGDWWGVSSIIDNGETVTSVDLWTGTSSATYQLRGQMWRKNTQNSSGGPEITWEPTTFGGWRNRFLGAFNAFK